MKLRDAFLHQAENNAGLGSPFTARVLTLLGRRLRPGTPLTDRMFGWPGDIGASGAAVPLRLLAGLHALVLTSAAPALVAVYPPNPAPGDDALWGALQDALTDHARLLNRWLDSPPQTNEVRRAAVLIAAGHWLTDRFGLPLSLNELGASAGLNLMWDRFALQAAGKRLGPQDAALTLTPEWRGALPRAAAPRVADRRGVDIGPLDPHDPDDALRLTSYLWADQPERLTRTRAAIDVATAAVDKGDAATWLEARLAAPRPDRLHLIYHTIAWQYFAPATQTRCLAAMAAAGKRAPVARLGLEADETRQEGAALTLTLWPEGEAIALGRADFHGRWVDWQAG